MPGAESRLARSRSLAAVLAAGLAASAAHAAVDVPAAAAALREAAALCGADGGALWGHSLCGAVLFVDPQDNSAVANQADAGGVLQRSGAVFAGRLPKDAVISSSPIVWSGTLWSEMLWPLPDDEARRHVELAHEMFHRIQPDLGMERGDGGNAHLDTLEGRVLLQLEWRALAAALRADDDTARRQAAADALAFRHQRYKLFADAAATEGVLERNEGVAEYTGVMIGLPTPAARTAYALQDLAEFVHSPSFVRSFAYATGPAYGLLLNQADPGWRKRLVPSGKRLDELLAAAWHLPDGVPTDLARREAVYDDGSLRAAETKREADSQARLAAWKAKLVDGPVFLLPIVHGSVQFNPQTLQPLGDAGIVYPTLRIVAAWGTLEVDGGALVDKDMKTATLPAAGLGAAARQGEGWHLELKPGWSLVPGARPGDWLLQADPK